ncbi:hypothetical protein V6N11_084189 [Hibiscus sabdariffa]|uniref:Uncharacterized protein n=1 Tax=Hibiscus sabdariffa TaxID=183260 RepID=A0ABR2QSS2_9ROSI
MESEWRRISEEFVSHFSIIEKLRLLKVFLELWTHESFGSVKLQIKVTMDLMNDLEDGDRGVEEQGLSWQARDAFYRGGGLGGDLLWEW